MTITKKLYLMTGIAFFLLVMITAINLLSNRSGHGDLTRLINYNVVPLVSIQQIDRDLLEVRYRIITVSIGMMPRSPAMAHLSEVRQRVGSSWKVFAEAHRESKEYGDEIGKIDSGLKAIQPLFDKLDKLYQADDRKGMGDFLEDDWPLVIAKVTRPIGELVKRESQAMQDERVASESRAMNRIYFAFAVLAFASVVMLVQALLLVKSVRRSISTIQDVIVEIGKGNLAVHAPGESGGQAGATTNIGAVDEIGKMARSLNLTVEALNQTLTVVGVCALSVNTAAEEIATAAGDQASTSNELSTTVVEITSTMEELSASSTQIAEHSRTVVEIANHTWENSKKGAEAMQVVLAKMGDIRSDNQHSLQEIVELGGKSKEISKVMAIINALADQTKLIAFNAALEASSAGESGRRFGVVAAEIRRLADSVTDSTGEIEAKVNEIQGSISRLVITSEKGAAGIADGMEATAGTAERLGELVGAASQTSSAAQQISLSTQQQKTASSQVLVALREIVSASSNTAQSINRISQVSQEMTGMSAELSHLVGQFKLVEGDATGVETVGGVKLGK